MVASYESDWPVLPSTEPRLTTLIQWPLLPRIQLSAIVQLVAQLPAQLLSALPNQLPTQLPAQLPA
jgi:hypothetical protein